jgi:hypothetical protein
MVAFDTKYSTRYTEAAAQKASKFHFGGDAEEDEEGVLTFKQEVEGDDDDAESEEGAEEQGDEAPEDDFNAAWDVLDLARSLYAKMDDNASKLKLADTYVALGDVSLETGVRFRSTPSHITRVVAYSGVHRKIRSSHL